MSSATSELRDAILTAHQAFMSAFGNSDAAGLAALYTSDGQLLPTNSDVVTGTAAIEEFWQAAFEMGLKYAKLEIAELYDHGDTATEVGRYELGDGEGNAVDQGKYVVIWNRVGDAWKLHRDIWNTSNPAA